MVQCVAYRLERPTPQIMASDLQSIIHQVQSAPQPAIPGAQRDPRSPRSGPLNPWPARDNAILALAELIGRIGATSGITMNVMGVLSSVALPLGDLGIELASGPATLFSFFGLRQTPGASGITQVGLEKNGVLLPYTLEWLATDPAFTVEFAEIKLKVVQGDRLSLRLLSAEEGAENLYCVVSA